MLAVFVASKFLIPYTGSRYTVENFSRIWKQVILERSIGVQPYATSFRLRFFYNSVSVIDQRCKYSPGSQFCKLGFRINNKCFPKFQSDCERKDF